MSWRYPTAEPCGSVLLCLGAVLLLSQCCWTRACLMESDRAVVCKHFRKGGLLGSDRVTALGLG